MLGGALALHLRVQPYEHAYQNQLETVFAVGAILFVINASLLNSALCQASEACAGKEAHFTWTLLVALLSPAVLYGVYAAASGGRRRVSPTQLRQLLLVDDEGARPGGAVAPFGEFSINATEVAHALQGALLTDEERATLRDASLRAAASASPTSERYTADAKSLVLGAAAEAARACSSTCPRPSCTCA